LLLCGAFYRVGETSKRQKVEIDWYELGSMRSRGAYRLQDGLIEASGGGWNPPYALAASVDAAIAAPHSGQVPDSLPVRL